MDIEGKVALITGGAGGLGLGAASALVDRGASVALLDLPSSNGETAADRLGDAVFVPVDVRQPEAVEAAVADAATQLGRIDICLNAAGVGPAHRILTRDGTLFPLDLFTFVIGVNLIGTFDVIRWAASFMSRNEPNDDGERGVVINVASIAAYEGQIGQAAYSASKGGIVGMTLPLARDLASYGIRVLAVAPGIMDTPMLAGATDELKASLAEVHVFPKRLGRPDDFAKLVVAMVENPLLNGEVVRLDAAARMPPR
jgi:3-hydroxyacyl-CoA dehydrogenase/3-hydroxy-2-methylbutyryl-CoA dehydrogenase